MWKKRPEPNRPEPKTRDEAFDLWKAASERWLAAFKLGRTAQKLGAYALVEAKLHVLAADAEYYASFLK